jgi:HlyD family secretion protein
MARDEGGLGMSWRTRARIVLAFAGIVVILALGALVMRQQTTTHAEKADPGGDKDWQAVAPGRVEPRSGTIRITAPVVGVVKDVLVATNDKVFAGEPVIRLNDAEQRARLAATEAEVALRERLRDSRSASGRAQSRRDAEDALAEADTEVYDARSAIDTAAVRRRTGGGSDGEVDTARAALARAQERAQARAAALRRLEADAPLPSQSEAQLSIARADRTVARAALEKMTIRAPIDGTVLQVGVKAGETAAVSAPQPLLLIGDVSALRVRAELDERDFAGIKIGQAVVVRAAAFPGREFVGKVASVAPIAEPARISPRGAQSLTDFDVVEVLVDLTDPGPLAPGMKVDAFFRRNALN